MVKALSPFCSLGAQRTPWRCTWPRAGAAGAAGTPLPHIVTTSYLTHHPIAAYLEAEGNYGYPGELLLSPGRSVGLRLVPMTRDLRFAWEEVPQQVLDERAQLVRESLHSALISWARETGEGNDYTDSHPPGLHPVGHWYELPNLLRNGVLAGLLRRRPQLQYLVLHNIDTVGMDVDPAILGWHIRQGATLTFEVTTRRLEDRGRGPRPRGRAATPGGGPGHPREEAEFRLSYYSSNTTWVHLTAP